ncbi:hypothetical protein ACFLU5_06005 [Bacteroidota bacterium]
MVKFYIFLIIIITGFVSCKTETNYRFNSSFPDNIKRHWIGPEYWSNRLEDWQINNGRLECINGFYQLRNVHLLTHYQGDKPGKLKQTVNLGLLTDSLILDQDVFAGFIIGVGDLSLDYRARSLIHGATGKNGGIIAAINGKGELIFLDAEQNFKILKSNKTPIVLNTNKSYQLTLEQSNSIENSTQLSLYILDDSGKVVSTLILDSIPSKRLSGNLALTASNGHKRQAGPTFWFNNWQISGDDLIENENQKYGPVYGIQYTQSKGKLKLIVQFAPVSEDNPNKAKLEIKSGDNWKMIAEAEIDIPSWTSIFSIENWDSKKEHKFRIVYDYIGKEPGQIKAFYDGIIKKEPLSESEFTIAAFTGNLNSSFPFLGYGNQAYFDFTLDNIFFPHVDLDKQVIKHDPDLLFYSGDQIYEVSPYLPDKSGEFSSYLNYLQKWYLFYWAHGDLTRNIPSISIPDDHDVFQINLWGDGGKAVRSLPEGGSYDESINKLPERYQNRPWTYIYEGGGYEMPPEWVNMIERTQTGHLPDPYDPSPAGQGIGVYYTDMLYGGISFAILEDRKFKSSPAICEPAKTLDGHPINPDFNAKMEADVPGAILLGQRQLDFLNSWAADWEGTSMKVCFSQTILANIATRGTNESEDQVDGRTISVPQGIYPKAHKLNKDFDSDGWPQTGRNLALDAIRRGYGFMIAGDQHLGTVAWHGIDNWNDAGWSFCVPAVANIAPRRWFPPFDGKNREEGSPRYTGEFEDGFGNKINVKAVSNPYDSDHEPALLHDRATGYGIVIMNKKEQKITMECWPRWADPENDDQYPGWPITIDMQDNYGKEAVAWLPEIQISGLQTPPIIQIIDEQNNEIVYTRRMKELTFRPKVFKSGLYTIRISEPGTDISAETVNVSAVDSDLEKNLIFNF